jgi:hypothetical protein
MGSGSRRLGSRNFRLHYLALVHFDCARRTASHTTTSRLCQVFAALSLPLDMPTSYHSRDKLPLVAKDSSRNIELAVRFLRKFVSPPKVPPCGTTTHKRLDQGPSRNTTSPAQLTSFNHSHSSATSIGPWYPGGNLTVQHDLITAKTA